MSGNGNPWTQKKTITVEAKNMRLTNTLPVSAQLIANNARYCIPPRKSILFLRGSTLTYNDYDFDIQEKESERL
jgi:hypothetical protein